MSSDCHFLSYRIETHDALGDKVHLGVAIFQKLLTVVSRVRHPGEVHLLGLGIDMAHDVPHRAVLFGKQFLSLFNLFQQSGGGFRTGIDWTLKHH